MYCKDIMRRPVQKAREGDTVQVAARRMRDANIGILPVINGDGHAIGAITDRDLAMRVCADGLSPADTLVGEVFTRKVVSCLDTDDIEHAERLMARHKTSRILVVDHDDELVGVISLSDIAVRDELHALETLRQVARREVLGGGRLAR